MGVPGSKRPPKGVQTRPKGIQKVAKRHEKDIQKASTRHPNAISNSISNSIGNSIGNAIGNGIGNAIGNAIGNNCVSLNYPTTQNYHRTIRRPQNTLISFRHDGGNAKGNWIYEYI